MLIRLVSVLNMSYILGKDVHRNFFSRLNLDKLEWEVVYMCNSQVDYEPRGRYRHELGFDGQNIYLLGGGTNEEANGFRNIPTFDIKKRTWSKQKTRKDQSRGELIINYYFYLSFISYFFHLIFQ